MQRDLNLERNVVYPAKADRYPGGDRYEGGPLAPHHAVRLRAQPEVERKLRGRFKCYVAVGSFFVQQGPRTNTGAHHTHVHTHLGCSIAV